MNLHASEDAFTHKVDMPSKLVELKIARMQCIEVFANMPRLALSIANFAIGATNFSLAKLF